MPSRISITADFTPPAALGGYVMAYPALRWFGTDKGFAIDVAETACFPEQDAPESADVLVNLANGVTTNNGSVLVQGGVAFTGTGFDFSACTRNDNYVSIANAFDAIEAAAETFTAETTNASTTLTVTDAGTATIKVGSVVSGTGIPAATRITALGAGAGTYTMSAAATATGTITGTIKHKEWLGVVWMKVPPAAQWPAAGSSTGFAGTGPYTTAVDPVMLYYVTAGDGTKNMVVRIQLAIGSTTNTHTVTLVYTNFAAYAEKVGQLSIYRQNNTVRAKFAPLDGSAPFSPASITVAANTESLSGLTWRFGLISPTNLASGTSNPLAARDAVAAHTRFYSATVQSLAGVTQDPATLIADNFVWAQTYATYA